MYLPVNDNEVGFEIVRWQVQRPVKVGPKPRLRQNEIKPLATIMAQHELEKPRTQYAFAIKHDYIALVKPVHQIRRQRDRAWLELPLHARKLVGFVCIGTAVW